MIVKIFSAGRSFSGLGQYLAHDPQKTSKRRLGWVESLNCANEHDLSAIDEMIWCSRNAELLKQEAGIVGGKACQKPVKHVSLNWAQDQEPTREHMLETAHSFLEHMGWSEHQVLIYNHKDKRHDHIHLMVNMVHPETGKCLDDGFEKRRAQKWALEYEMQTGLYCEQRLEAQRDRETSPTRENWLAFKEAEQQFQKQEAARREYNPDYLERNNNLREIHSEEWKILKEFQKNQRLEFFSNGRDQFNDVRREAFTEIREQFRERWADYYAAKENGGDPAELELQRKAVIEEQRIALAAIRDERCAALHEDRDARYKALLAEHRDMRSELRERQDQGLTSTHLLDLANPVKQEQSADNELTRTDQQTELLQVDGSEERSAENDRGDDSRSTEGDAEDGPIAAPSGVRPGLDVAGNLTFGLIGGFASISDRLFDGFLGGSSAKPSEKTQPDPQPERRPNPFVAAAEEAHRREEKLREERDEEWWEERRSRSRE